MNKSLLVFAVCMFGTVAGWAQTDPGVVFPIKQVSVSSPVQQEIINNMRVKEGDVVKAGDVVVELRKEREELDVLLSQKLIELKRFTARGKQRLFKEEMGSEEQALEAKTDLELAELQLKAKEIALKEKTILSPIDGTVVKKYKETGESVSREEKLLDIVNLDRVVVRFNLPVQLRQSLKPQATVTVKVTDLNGAEFSGKIVFVDPRNDPASNKVPVWVELENKEHRIAPGMRATGDFGK